MNEVELTGITKSYGDHFALDDVSVVFQSQKITAIVGHSGSGKSTLLKTINGLVQPSAGRITVSGKPLDYQNISAQRRQIGYVVQGYGLFPHLTVAENISLPGKIAGKEEPSRVKELLTFTGLSLSYINKYPSELSGGEQQRVALCRALFLRPPVLLLDEPFGSLDTPTRENLQEKLLQLQKALKLTVIIVTHDIPEANRLAEQIFILENGKLKHTGI